MFIIKKKNDLKKKKKKKEKKKPINHAQLYIYLITFPNYMSFKLL